DSNDQRPSGRRQRRIRSEQNAAKSRLVSAIAHRLQSALMVEDLATPCIVIDAQVVRRNVERMAAYTRAHRLGLRPHTKTHKSTFLGRMQVEQGAVGLTVAKVGEAQVMAEVSDDLLMAYPAVDRRRCAQV